MATSALKTLLLRSCTGVIFVGIIIAALLYSSYATFVVFGIAMYISMVEFFNMTYTKGVSKRYMSLIKLLSVGMYAAVYFFSRGRLGFSPLLLVAPYFILLAISELFDISSDTFVNVGRAAANMLYIILPYSLVSIMVNNGSEFNGTYLLTIFGLIWANDSFAYLFGVSLGKHRMWERISPKKSWEGFIGGGLTSVGLSLVLAHFFFPSQMLQMAGLAVIVVVFGTFGDLFESQLKRQFKVKDSGNSLPGHGGFLDRFDSFIFIIPMAMLYLEIVA